MALDYTALARTADALIGDNGQVMTVSRETGGSINFANQTREDDSTQSYSVSGALFGKAGSNIPLDKKFADDVATKESAKLVIMSAFKSDGSTIDFDPDIGDTITIGGLVFNIIGIAPAAPSGINVIHKLGITR